MLKLYHNDMSTCSQKVRFLLAEKGVEWEGVELDLRGGDQQRPDFLKINPKGLVPALDHDGNIVVESNIIIEYLNDVYPEPPLLPADPAGRAKARWWMKKLDDGMHLEVAVLSFAIAFRHQLIKTCGSDEALEKHFAGIIDPYIQEVQRQVVPQGVDSPRFVQAVQQYEKLLSEMNEALASHQWLVGDSLSLADIAYSPYVTRLDHLCLQGMWDDKPHVADWYSRLVQTKGYREGVTNWFSDKYLPLMNKAGLEAWPRVAEIRDLVAY